MCKVLGLCERSYYQWKKGEEKRQEKQKEERRVAAKVREVFEETKRVYGSRRMRKALENEGLELSEWRIRRIMRENGMYPESIKRYRPGRSGRGDGRFFENELSQDFTSAEPNRKWVGDITYLKTKIGWVYLAVVIDLWNREVIGYEVSRNIDTELVLRALGNALLRRGKAEGPLIFHSDRGCQYSSRRYQRILLENQIQGSMSKAGCPYDNSCVESFFASLKKEHFYRHEYATIDDVRRDLFYYIEIFYNRKRLHSALGYMSPVAYRLKRMGLSA